VRARVCSVACLTSAWPGRRAHVVQSRASRAWPQGRCSLHAVAFARRLRSARVLRHSRVARVCSEEKAKGNAHASSVRISAALSALAIAATHFARCSWRIRMHGMSLPFGSPSSVFAARATQSLRLGCQRHNPSIERTNNGGQGCAALRASRAPLFAAHVERYAAANPTFACAGLCGARKGVQRGASRFGVAR
jgi:hypothetical protein